MRFLITGANGFVGSWLAKELAERGGDVRCLVRRGGDRSPLDGAKVSVLEGDVTEESSLVPALDGVDVCFHLAGIRRGSTRADFMGVNAEGTRCVAEAMVAVGARRLVLGSSLAASGPSGPDRPRDEADPLCPEEWYGESKAEAERIAFSFAGRLEVTAIRPSRIIGPGDRENLTFFRLVKRGFVLKLGGAERLLSMVDVGDVVQQLVLQGEQREAVGEAFFCASDELISLEALMRLIAEALKVAPRTIYAPEVVLSALGQAADLVSNVTGRKLPLSRKLARQILAPGWVCSVEKAKRLLGYRPKVPLRDSVMRSTEAYLRAGWL